jgi:replication factor A1
VTVTLEKKRYDGTQIRQAEAIVGDQHGCVKLIARDKQLDVVKEGAVITVRNAHAAVVNEHLRIEIDRWGKVESSTEKVDSVLLSNNHSDIEYELVHVRK